MKTPIRIVALVALAVAMLLPFTAPAPIAAQDTPLAARTPIRCAVGQYPYYSPTDALWYCSTTQPAVYNATTLTATATELNKLAGVTAGTAAASKAVVLDANKAVDVVRTADLRIGVSGSETAVTATAAELNALASGGISAAEAVQLGLITATGAEVNKVAGVTGGTVTASKAVVVDANKAVDAVRATTERTLGGTGVPGAANVSAELMKEVTAIADNTATTVLTISVPNGAHAAMFEIDVIGRLGAGGAIGADEAVSSSKYQGTCARTAGVASVCTLSSQLGAVNVAVAGAATVTAVLTQVASAEGVGATNTHLIKITIARSGGSSANHKADLHVRLHNANASGITVS